MTNKSYKIAIVLVGLAALTAGIALGARNKAPAPEAATESISLEAVEVGDYKNLDIPVALKEVTDEDVQDKIDEMISQSGGLYIREDKEAEEGDQVSITYYQFDDNGVVDDTAHTGLVVLGSGEYPKEFEDALLGTREYDNKEVTITEDGEEKKYSLNVTGVSVKGELTDEYVNTLGIENITTIKELEAFVRDYLEKENQTAYDTDFEKTVMDAVLSGATYNEVPDELVKTFEETINNRMQNVIEYYSTEDNEVTLKDILGENMEAEGFVGTPEEYIHSAAVKNAREYLVYSAIAEKENITVSEDEIYDRMATDWLDQMDKYETFLSYLENNDKEQYRKVILSEKVKKYLVDVNKNGEGVSGESSSASSSDLESASDASSAE